MDNQFEAPKGRLLSTVVIFVFAVVVLYTLFLLFQQFSFGRSVSKIEGRILELETQISTLKDDQIEELYVAQQLDDLVSENMIHWSLVIKKLEDLTPVTVFFSSYSGSRDGSIQLSGLGDSYGSVSDVISALTESSDFIGTFVPSVTLGTTSDGQEVVSFSLETQSNF